MLAMISLKITSIQGCTKINEHVKSEFYHWIIRYPQTFQSPIANDCIKITIDEQITPQLVLKLLFQVSSTYLHNSMVSPIEEGGIKEAREKYSNIIISDTTLRKILPPLVKKITSRYKVMCGCECCIATKRFHCSLLTWRDRHMKHL